MDRRRFCKLSAMAALGVCGKVSMAREANAASGFARWRITVLRRECFPDLQSRYLSDPETGPCQMFSTGQTFVVEYASGGKFCSRAWRSITEAVDASMKSSVCADANARNVAIASCGDGTRPVIFCIEIDPSDD